jgi:hypothetical protein
VKKITLVVVAVCALAVVALIPTDASALVACWAVSPFGETVCMEVTFGTTAIALHGFYLSAFPCNGTTSIPAQGTVISAPSGFSLGIVVDFAAPAPGGNGGGCFSDTQHVLLTLPSLGGTGSHRNVAGATGAITYTLSSLSSNETLSDVQERLSSGVPAGGSSAGSP